VELVEIQLAFTQLVELVEIQLVDVVMCYAVPCPKLFI